MAKKNKTFIFWSGGLDSSYLIYDYLKDGYPVVAGHINIKNNAIQMKREQEAIKKMLPIFNAYENFEYVGSILDILIKTKDTNICLSQVPILILGTLFAQNIKGVKNIAIAYAANDDAISYLKDIGTIYDAYAKLMYSDMPNLLFPLNKMNKQAIYKDTPKKILKCITFCESNKDKCGECPSCLRWEYMQKRLKGEQCKNESNNQN